jgi:hypothetical protein
MVIGQVQIVHPPPTVAASRQQIRLGHENSWDRTHPPLEAVKSHNVDTRLP